MTSLEILGIYVLLLANLGLTVILAREGATRILLAVQDLDQNLATVITNLGQSLPTQMEGINPIQMAIAQWIGAQAQARSNLVETTVTRADTGQFKKLDDF